MWYLFTVSAIWSASFGIFKTYLTDLNPSLTAFLRLLLALVLFLPFLRVDKLPWKGRVTFFCIGIFEYGLMSVALNSSYRFLDAWQVALMTLFTPIYIVAIDSVRNRHLDILFLVAAVLAAGGAAVVMYRPDCILPRSLPGCFLVQCADICFAIGLLAYREARKKYDQVSNRDLYALSFAGGVTICLLAAAASGGLYEIVHITRKQWFALLYMGMVSSGICLFFWNIGATKVSTGILASMSNIKVPMAIAVSLLFFGEHAGNWHRLLLGSIVMIAAIQLARIRGLRCHTGE